ncbi:MAG TPA: TIR domain-containing protein [bacterium]|nr:TIR domain-containing protein [bacterium]
MNPFKCPHCFQPLAQNAQSWVCTQHGSFILPDQFAQHRLFISYGHDEHVAVARRLRDDLQARGHLVWFDEQRLVPGYDWEAFIEKGLNDLVMDKSNAEFLLLLTPHAVRRPDGYCLNEVARALSHGLRIIPLMVVESEPPLSICRIQWLDLRDCIPIHEKETLYKPRFERLLKAIEEKQLDFEGSQSRLLQVLQPIQFSADILKLLKDFTGRRWVFDEVDRWLANPNGEKIFWLTGAPGVGKSAIAAWIRENRREIAAFHFCDINSEEKRDPAKMVRSIVYQLSTQLPEYQERLVNLPLESIVAEFHEAYTLFDKLLVQPLAENIPAPDRTVVILIDALDEATRERKNEIVRFLAQSADKTPLWLRFLVTSRPEPETISSLQSLNPYVLDTHLPENLEDLAAFLRAQIPAINQVQLDEILSRSEGVFLYVRHVCEGLQAGTLSLDRLDAFPRGLGDVYQQFFNRQFPDLNYYEESIAPLLQPVFAANTPLTLGFLKQLVGISSETELGRRLNRLGSLFPASGESDSDTLRPFHRTLCDWITNRDAAGDYMIALKDGHRLLSEEGWRQYQQQPEEMNEYTLEWLPAHLRELGDEEKLPILLQDFRYLMSKIRRGMLERLLQDFRELPDKLCKDKLDLIVAFFREKAHILRRGNAAWPAYKTFLQLAMEHADDSPITRGAEQWLVQGYCDWFWMRRIPRLEHAQKNLCLLTLEGHEDFVAGALELCDGRLLSWSFDKFLRIWDSTSGRCLATLKGHTDTVTGALQLSSGRLLSWSGDSTLRLWDSESGQPLAILEGHAEKVNGVLLLSNGRLLSWSGDHTLRLWDSETGQPLVTLEGHSEEVTGALQLSDGWILSWSKDNTLRMWDSTSGWPLVILAGHTDLINGALQLSDGRLLSWSNDKTLRLWDSTSGQPIATLIGHKDRVKGALELSDGRFLSWSEDFTLHLWNSANGQPPAILAGHTNWVEGALELSNGQLLSWAWDHTLRLWDNIRGQLLATLEGHAARVNGALQLSDGQLLSWSREHTLRLWDGISYRALSTLVGHTDWIEGALQLSDGRLLSWSDDCSLRIWSSVSNPHSEILAGSANQIDGILVLSNRQLLSWSEDNVLRLWNSTNGRPFITMMGHHDKVMGAMELFDNSILSWSWDGTLRIWDCTSGQSIAILKGHTSWVSGAFAFLDGRIVSWAYDNTLRLWDGTDGKLLAILEGHVGRVMGVLELPDDRLLSWSLDHTLRIWDSTSSQTLATLEGHTDTVTGALQLSSGHLLSWSRDHTLRLWDSKSGCPLSTLEGHTDAVGGAMELSDGRLLTWSWDTTLRLWDSTSGQPLATLEGHTDFVRCALEFSRSRLLSWSRDHTLRLWDSNNGICLDCINEDEAIQSHPEWLHVVQAVNKPQAVFSGFSLHSSGIKTHIVQKARPGIIGAWQAESSARVQCLQSDGTAIVTQSNSQVCFLKLYHRNRRISFAEAEELLGKANQ